LARIKLPSILSDGGIGRKTSFVCGVSEHTSRLLKNGAYSTIKESSMGSGSAAMLTKILGELSNHPQVIARGDGRVVATLKFLQHDFS
jgi:hypothetical protein